VNLSSELKIETPEGIQFSYALAGPISRCLAWVVDLIVIGIVLGVARKVVGIFALVSGDLASGLFIVCYFSISIGYGVLTEWAWRGQTIGKRIFRLRVMDVYGLRLQFHQILLRNLLRAVDSLPACYLVGGLCCFFSKRAQRLGDLAAGTVVVHHAQPEKPDLEQLLAGKFNSLRAYPHLAARLRQRVSPAEATLALQALLRREEFEPTARVNLFRSLAEHFRAAVPFPAEAVESLPDEQYVRNVVDVLFRAREPNPSH
jgi:uncharacterized RDD family membrane protein YckC